jgi:hypothetical protein
VGVSILAAVSRISHAFSQALHPCPIFLEKRQFFLGIENHTVSSFFFGRTYGTFPYYDSSQ